MVRRIGFLVAMLWMWRGLGGCVAVYSYRGVCVDVRDAETGRPIANAEVTAMNGTMFVVNHPEPDQRMTDECGQALVSVAEVGRMEVSVRAAGYTNDGGIPNRDGEWKSYHRVEFRLKKLADSKAK